MECGNDTGHRPRQVFINGRDVGATALSNYEMPTSTHDAVPGLLAEKH